MSNIVVSVDGVKVATVEVADAKDKVKTLAAVKKDPAVKEALKDKKISRDTFVPEKIVNFFTEQKASAAAQSNKLSAPLTDPAWWEQMRRAGKMATLEDGIWTGPEDAVLFVGYPHASLNRMEMVPGEKKSDGTVGPATQQYIQGRLMSGCDKQLIRCGQADEYQCQVFVRFDIYEPSSVMQPVEEEIADEAVADDLTA